MPKYFDRTGVRYGILTVLGRSNKSPCHEARWLCLCDCGNMVDVLGGNLTQGNCSSCGCGRTRQTDPALIPKPEFGCINVPLTQGKWAVIDAHNEDRIMDKLWHFTNSGYACHTNKKNGLSSHVFMEKMILGTNRKIDHRNGNKLDNREVNLRFATVSENACNSKLSIKNTSGYKGVYRDGSMWYARITKDKVIRHLGYFKSKEDAIIARKLAEKLIHGEFARHT